MTYEQVVETVKIEYPTSLRDDRGHDRGLQLTLVGKDHNNKHATVEPQMFMLYRRTGNELRIFWVIRNSFAKFCL